MQAPHCTAEPGARTPAPERRVGSCRDLAQPSARPELPRATPKFAAGRGWGGAWLGCYFLHLGVPLSMRVWFRGAFSGRVFSPASASGSGAGQEPTGARASLGTQKEAPADPLRLGLGGALCRATVPVPPHTHTPQLSPATRASANVGRELARCGDPGLPVLEDLERKEPPDPAIHLPHPRLCLWFTGVVLGWSLGVLC